MVDSINNIALYKHIRLTLTELYKVYLESICMVKNSRHRAYIIHKYKSLEKFPMSGMYLI